MPSRFLRVLAVLCICAPAAAWLAMSRHSIFAASGLKQLSQTQAQPAPLSPSADMVLTNGKIYTGLASEPWATALAIRGETIVALARADADAQVKPWLGPKTRVIDLHGQFAMPGFNDAHAHLAGGAYRKLEVDLSGAQSLEELQQRVRNRLKDYGPGEWIVGPGWDHTLWPVKKFPNRYDLDSISTDHPMFFQRTDGHVAVVNSRALSLAGITRATPDPPGGHIERDPQTGEPTGMLEEGSAMSLVYERIPPYSKAQRLKAFRLVMDEASQFGVTSIQDNSVMASPDGNNFGWLNFLVYGQLQREGKLKIRVTEWLPFSFPLDRLEEMRRTGGTTDPWLKTGALKALIDGSLGSRTAALLAPYSDDPATSGILRLDPATVAPMAIERDRAGFQIAFHAIGDRANRIALDTFAAVQEAGGARERRDRVEHAQIVAPGDFARFASLGVVASMQPSHLLDDERWATDRLGPERVKGAYAWHTMEQDGVHLAFGTDYPVESINPLRGIYACVTRELPAGGPAGGWQPQEKLSMDDCLRAYTAGSAFAEFEEKQKGTIAPGMLADIVVFPVDITRIPPRDLLTTQVSMTIAGGRIVYEPSR
ncbi:MAG: amidohydrolase [Candidatus Acidiferrales bacterium]